MTEPLPYSRAVISTVRTMRKHRGMTAERLAQLMDEAGYATTRASIASAEIGRIKEISIDWLWAASYALNAPVKMILFGPDCTHCTDKPPPGYTCNRCGKEA